MSRTAKPGSDAEQMVAVATALLAHEEGRKAVHIGGNHGTARPAQSPWKQMGRLRALRGRL